MLLRGMDSFLAEVGTFLQAKEEEESDEIQWIGQQNRSDLCKTKFI